jgi:hypothetical protein
MKIIGPGFMTTAMVARGSLKVLCLRLGLRKSIVLLRSSNGRDRAAAQNNRTTCEKLPLRAVLDISTANLKQVAREWVCLGDGDDEALNRLELPRLHGNTIRRTSLVRFSLILLV